MRDLALPEIHSRPHFGFYKPPNEVMLVHRR